MIKEPTDRSARIGTKRRTPHTSLIASPPCHHLNSGNDYPRKKKHPSSENKFHTAQTHNNHNNLVQLLSNNYSSS